MTAQKIVREALEIGGFPVEIAGRIRLESNSRFSRRMGDARCTSQGQPLIVGVIRLSSHALWRCATPEKRRNTVVHELAHVIAWHKFGRTEGHGPRWKSIMRKLGEAPKRCHTVNREGIRRPQERRSPQVVVVNQGARVASFGIGSLVTFTHKGLTFVCRVEKRNPKTVQVKEVGGRQRVWRVSPSILALMA